ncbi:MAG: HAD family hydrolase [Flavisolibacter sp.]
MDQPKSYEAFIFDLNGTMINDMNYHIRAWHEILNRLGAGISRERVKEECYGKNHELLERIFPGRFSLQEKDRMSYDKEKTYQKEFRPHLQLINGLETFLKQIKTASHKIAIGSAAILFNIDFVVDGLQIRSLIDAIVSADDVCRSKPHPETFLKCAEILSLPPSSCLVFEDTPKGAEAAANAGMDCIIITTLHHPADFKDQTHIKAFIKDFTDERLARLL